MFDIIILGGGHAGVEAAYIASQFKDLKIAIISLPGIGLASAPCNPAIGGVGKGQVVRELDALGGLIGKLADLAGIQYRTLNDSKGYAVQSTRVQIDKEIYSINAEKILSETENISIIKQKVLDITYEDENYIISTNCSTWNTKKLIVTVGTFLNGCLHTGSEIARGGRRDTGEFSKTFQIFEKIKLNPKKFKTGTPPRLKKDSINYKKVEIQPSDSKVGNFHYENSNNNRKLPQVNCYLTYTNENTLKTIRANKEKSPMFNGQIKAVGARYCPSIEDKAYRYPDKNIHHVFLEPEGLSSQTVYPSGISTSLPANIQKDFVNSIKGLENAEIIHPGYAVEYNVLDTTELNTCLESKKLKGLYFAGQINGTSGYEEASAQGFIAGVNAALNIQGKKSLVLKRSESYIGVLIEDLILNTRDEPYRLFTARSENRLFLREDNANLRMYLYRKQLGLNMGIDQYNQKFCEMFHVVENIIKNFYISPDDKFLIDNEIKIPCRQNIESIITKSIYDPIKVLSKFLASQKINIDNKLLASLAISSKYSGYIERANKAEIKINSLDLKLIDWKKLSSSNNVSFECKERIEKIKPETFGQLRQIKGIRPATLAIVASGNL